MSLTALLDPASVAVIGASQNPDKIGGRPIRFMKEMGYRGRIFPINPGRAEIQGLRCYSTWLPCPRCRRPRLWRSLERASPPQSRPAPPTASARR